MLTVRDGPVAVLPRESVAVTRIVTRPPFANCPMSATQSEPRDRMVALPEPAPLQRSTTEARPLSSETLTLTGLLVQVDVAPALGWPTLGSRSSTSETLTSALPETHEMPIVPEDDPSRTSPRSARTATCDDVPPSTRPVDGDAESQAVLEVSR